MFKIAINIYCSCKVREVKFQQVAAHVGVRGDERVDELAKRAVRKRKIEMQVSINKAEVKCVVWGKKHLKVTGRVDREGRGGHLQIQSVKVTRVGSGNRREEIVLTRLRLRA